MSKDEKIRLAHGGGGRLMQELIHEVFLPPLGNEILDRMQDSAAVDCVRWDRLAFTTDSYVVSPPFFPGGDIGRLAVCGTVNDLAVTGAIPRFLSCAVILEEGFPMELLERIVNSMAQAAEEAKIQIVTGDTKTVGKDKADGVFITTAGIGEIPPNIQISPDRIQCGDIVIVNGFLGDHGLAVIKARGEFDLEYGIQSDVAPLNGLVRELLLAAPQTRFIRDLTRGGLNASLCEMTGSKPWSIVLNEESIPIRDEIRAFCEILGYDPLTIANEGKMVMVVPCEQAETAINALRKDPLGLNAAIIGKVEAERPGSVLLRTSVGGTRILDLPMGEQLPRIC